MSEDLSQRIVAMGVCRRCGTFFMFDAEQVPSVVVDSRSGREVPADTPVPTNEAGYQVRPEYWVKMPLCDTCAEKVEKVRETLGLPVAWPRRKAGGRA